MYIYIYIYTYIIYIYIYTFILLLIHMGARWPDGGAPLFLGGRLVGRVQPVLTFVPQNARDQPSLAQQLGGGTNLPFVDMPVFALTSVL